MDVFKLIIDEELLDEYAEYYFRNHPKARKRPIEKPWHPSINEWMVMPRPQMNALKQRWKDFGVWWINKLGYTNLMLDSFDMVVTVFFNTSRRHDPDNYTIKFLADSFTAAGFIVDDDGEHLHSLTLMTDVDREYPRTEILVRVLNKEEQVRMTVKDFVIVYDLYEGNMDKIELEIVEYVPYVHKVNICKAVIEDSTYDEEGNFKMNSAFRNILYRMILIDSYTNIDVDYGNVIEEFDELESRNAINALLSYVSEDEIRRFDEIMQSELSDLYQNERSQAAIARRN